MIELSRFLRHLIAPLMIMAVERGWLPRGTEYDVTEALVIAMAFLLPLVWSYARDRIEWLP